MKRPMSITLDRDIVEEVDRYAKAKGLSKSALVGRALYDFFRTRDENKKPGRSQKRGL